MTQIAFLISNVRTILVQATFILLHKNAKSYNTVLYVHYNQVQGKMSLMSIFNLLIMISITGIINIFFSVLRPCSKNH